MTEEITSKQKGFGYEYRVMYDKKLFNRRSTGFFNIDRKRQPEQEEAKKHSSVHMCWHPRTYLKMKFSQWKEKQM